jgi:NAD(P)-dependent dehydrogenase (short-subunit alcohol dehydrogenase family)
MTGAPPPGRLRGRVCLVAGSTGIAEAAARRFAAEGAHLLITSRTAAHCDGLAESIRAAGGSALSREADLTDEVQVAAVAEACVAAFGRVDGVFAVAGGSGRRFGDGPIHALTADGWRRTFELNVMTQALVSREAVRRMLAQPRDPRTGSRGSILLMGSVLAFDPVPELFATHAYAAAKGAIASLMTTMAATYASEGIRVNAVAPGLVATPMAARAAADPDTVAFARRKQPLADGLLEPEDVAEAAVYFLSDESSRVTGQLLKVDGGWSVVSEGAGADEPADAGPEPDRGDVPGDGAT